jgi:hypothetical protein
MAGEVSPLLPRPRFPPLNRKKRSAAKHPRPDQPAFDTSQNPVLAHRPKFLPQSLTASPITQRKSTIPDPLVARWAAGAATSVEVPVTARTPLTATSSLRANSKGVLWHSHRLSASFAHESQRTPAGPERTHQRSAHAVRPVSWRVSSARQTPGARCQPRNGTGELEPPCEHTCNGSLCAPRKPAPVVRQQRGRPGYDPMGWLRDDQDNARGPLCRSPQAGIPGENHAHCDQR